MKAIAAAILTLSLIAVTGCTKNRLEPTGEMTTAPDLLVETGS